jgi:hypothetical protein
MPEIREINNEVPASACRLAIGEIEVSDANGDTAKTAPFKMIARSGRPIEHPWWGRVAHDLEGMELPSNGRVPVDYAHTDEVIGYANRFSTDSGDLVGSGALVPYGESDRAHEVIYKGRNGVPWQASISFGGSGIKLERVPENKTARVNGYDLAGPAIIVRKWPLRAIAVCHQGADQWTQTEFAAGETIHVDFIQEEVAMPQEMPVQATIATAEVIQPASDALPTQEIPVEATADLSTAEEVATPATDATTVEADRALRRLEGERFSASFGQRAGHYFLQGLSFAEALEQHLAWQANEIDRLTQLVSARANSMGEDAPVTFGEAIPPKKKEPAFKMPPGL